MWLSRVFTYTILCVFYWGCLTTHRYHLYKVINNAGELLPSLIADLVLTVNYFSPSQDLSTGLLWLWRWLICTRKHWQCNDVWNSPNYIPCACISTGPQHLKHVCMYANIYCMQYNGIYCDIGNSTVGSVSNGNKCKWNMYTNPDPSSLHIFYIDMNVYLVLP